MEAEDPPDSEAPPTAAPKRPISPPAREIFVRADEIDEAGADISAIALSDDAELQARVEARRAQDIARGPEEARPLANAVPGVGGGSRTGSTGAKSSPVRPILRREGSSNQPPPPPRQPPPPAPPAVTAGGSAGRTAQEGSQPRPAPAHHAPADSLSLAQLRELVAHLPSVEPPAYAYQPADTRGTAEELEEWFQYTAAERARLLDARKTAQTALDAHEFEPDEVSAEERRWTELPSAYQEAFLRACVEDVKRGEARGIVKGLECLAYVVMGAWSETAGAPAVPDPEEEGDFEPPDDRYLRALAQLRCIKSSAVLLCRLGAVEAIYGVLRAVSVSEQYVPVHRLQRCG